MKAILTFAFMTMVLAIGFVSAPAEAAGVCGFQRNCWVGGGCWDSHRDHFASERYCSGYSRGGRHDDYERRSSTSRNCYGTLLTAPEFGRNPFEPERYINCSVENCAGKTLRTPNSRRLITCY